MENSTTAQTTAEKLPDPAPRFEGQTFVLGGKTYVVPALNIRQAKAIAPRIDALASIETKTLDPASLDNVLAIVAPAFQRNYPEITVDELADLIDLKNAFELVTVVLGRPNTAVPSPD